jgi:branched-chain amino acid transport system permease protein
LTSLSFAHSAEVLVMLVLGGTGRLWGALVGTLVFMVVHHFAASVDPFSWMFVIGGLLLAVVLFMRGGLTGALAALVARRPEAGQ